jgi:hypothetical protein
MPWLALSETALMMHGNPTAAGGLPDGLFGGRGAHDLEGGLGDAGGCPPLPLPCLVGGVAHGIGRVVRQPHLCGYGRGQHEHRGVGGDHGVDRAGAGQDTAGAGVRIGRADGDDRAAAADGQGAVAADHQVQAHPGRGQQEIGGAVGAGGHQQQDSAPCRRRARGYGRVVPTPPSTASWKGSRQPTRRVKRVSTVSDSRAPRSVGNRGSRRPLPAGRLKNAGSAAPAKTADFMAPWVLIRAVPDEIREGPRTSASGGSRAGAAASDYDAA